MSPCSFVKVTTSWKRPLQLVSPKRPKYATIEKGVFEIGTALVGFMVYHFFLLFFSRFFIEDTEMESEDEFEDCERKKRSVNVYGRGVKHEGRRMDRRIQV
jgi:hypothetical protein